MNILPSGILRVSERLRYIAIPPAVIAVGGIFAPVLRCKVVYFLRLPETASTTAVSATIITVGTATGIPESGFAGVPELLPGTAGDGAVVLSVAAGTVVSAVAAGAVVSAVVAAGVVFSAGSVVEGVFTGIVLVSSFPHTEQMRFITPSSVYVASFSVVHSP